MIAGGELVEGRGCGMAVDRLQHVDVPLCPLGHAGGGSVGAGTVVLRRVARLHHRPVVRITGLVGSQPRQHHVAIGVGRHPGEDVGPALGRALIDDPSRRPRPAEVARRGEKDVAVVRPDGVEKAELIHGQRREYVAIRRSHGAGVDLVIGERERRQAQLCVEGNAHVGGTHRLAAGVFRDVVRRDEQLVQVAAAGAIAEVHFDLRREVGGRGRRYVTRCREGRRIDRLAERCAVRHAPIRRALHVDVEGGDVVIDEVDRLWVDGIVPLTVVPGNQRLRDVRCSEVVPAIGGMRARHSGCQCQAGERNVGNGGVGGIRCIDRDVGIAAAGRDAEILRRADIVGAPTVREAEDAAIIGLAFVLERQRAVAVGRPVQRLGPAPQVYASRDTADRDDVSGPLSVDAGAGFHSLDDERQRAQPGRRRRQLRQAQALVRAERSLAGPDERRYGLGYAATTRTVAFVGRGLSEKGGGSKRTGGGSNNRHQEPAHGFFSSASVVFQAAVGFPPGTAPATILLAGARRCAR